MWGVFSFWLYVLPYLHGGPTVTTPLGKLKGTYEETTYGKRKISSFLGIPYAVPPVGDLRFKAPVPISAWNGLRDASVAPNKCTQNDDGVKGSEDCLYVNIYTPELFESDEVEPKYPVVFYIHGGGFTDGSGYEYARPGFLLDHDVVLVTINYRLDFFGFMTTLDENSPGNYGLKDQVVALKWVHENIRSFGGNPEKILIGGLSAGGSSVHFHMLSPTTKGLFRRAISESGTALDPWAMPHTPLVFTKYVAAQVNCPTDDNKEMVECLKKASSKDIYTASGQLSPFVGNPQSPFAPTVEPSLPGAYLTKTPVEIIKSGDVADVPAIFGFVANEGCYLGATIIQSKDDTEELDNNYHKLLPYVLQYNSTVTNEEEAAAIENASRSAFFNNESILKTPRQLITLVTGRSLFISKTAELHTTYTKSPFYVYGFLYVTDDSLRTDIYYEREKVSSIVGGLVAHGDDDAFVVGPNTLTATPEVEPLVRRMTKLWSDFASNDTLDMGDWQPVQGNFSYYSIYNADVSQSKMETKDYFNQTFWNQFSIDDNFEMGKIYGDDQ